MINLNRMTIFVVLLLSASVLFAASPRMVILEEATNASCGLCAQYNPAYEEYLLEHLTEVIPIAYHAWWPGSDDPMYQNDISLNTTRINYYGITGVPDVFVNGVDEASPIPSTVDGYVAKYRGKTSPITITIDETKNGTSVSFTVTIASDIAISNKKLRIVAVEYTHHYDNAGTNGETEFPFIARKMVPTPLGTTLNIAAGGNQVYTNNYSITGDWTPAQMHLVAFVQDDGTKEILQAASSLKYTSAPMSVDNPFLHVDPNATVTKEITINNPLDQEFYVNLSIDTQNSYFPASDWSASISPAQVLLPAKGTTTATVSIKGGNSAGFCIAVAKATPAVSQGIVLSTTTSVYALSTATKCLVFAGADDQGFITFSELMSKESIHDVAALVPLSGAFMDNYPATEFDGAVFLFNYNGRGIFSGITGYEEFAAQMLTYINTLINNKKSLLIASEIDGYLAFNNGIQMSKDFYTNVLGVRPAGYTARFTTDGQGNITGIVSFPAAGVASDPITDGLSMILNQYSSSYTYYNLYTDYLTINAGSSAVPIITFDGDVSKIGGVRVEKDSAKIVYLCFTPEIIKDNTNRATFLNNICNWLFKTNSGNGGILTLDLETLSFGDVDVDNSKELSFTITNDGTADLKVSNMDISADWNEDNAFTFPENEELSFTVPAGEFHTVTVLFSPIKEYEYSAPLTITSDASNGKEKIVFLEGNGNAGNGARISTSAIDNSVEFGEVETTTYKLFDIEIHNDGNQELIVTSINFTQNDDDVYSFESGANTPFSIPEHLYKLLTIRFAPHAEGQTYNGAVRIQSNAINTALLDISLSGSGKVTSSVGDEPDATSNISVSPNPVSDKSIISYTVDGVSSQYTDLYLLDMSGRRVLDLTSGYLQPGEYTSELNAALLPSGKYILAGKIGSKNVTISVIVNK